MTNPSGKVKLISVLAPVAVIAGLLILFLNKMTLSNLILARGDTFLYFYPYWQASAEALRDLRVPFWNTSIFMGVPLLANSQAGFFYPLNWPLWWLLDTPYAVKASILLHLLIAGLGVYLLARRVLKLSMFAALVAAAGFALGGYLTAQVEHINQLQGLAWLPWFFLALPLAESARKYRWWLSTGLVAILFALQLLAGHTQTAFITAVAMAIWIAAGWLGKRFFSRGRAQPAAGPGNAGVGLLVLIAGGVGAMVLAAVQLLPMLELMGYSSRQRGLLPNEVMSFSLPPPLVTRTLLPLYGQSLFTEYVAFLPLVLLSLAFLGGWQWRRQVTLFQTLAATLSGFFLAFGAYNPLYWLLARLPGFNFFRAPARWLVLYALGVSLLAGAGWQILWQWASKEPQGRQERRQTFRSQILPPFLLFLLTLILLVIWGYAAGILGDVIPLGPEAPYERPSRLSAAGWLVEAALIAVAVVAIAFFGDNGRGRLFLAGLLATGLAAWFMASRQLPYNQLTTPEAFFDSRPSTARLVAEVENQNPPGRLLSLSDIFFDPGDQAEINSIYGDQLPADALYDYIVAIKQKEINAPNWPMVAGLASVDGFDGGLLPLRAYSQLMTLVLPDGQQTTDGRLREHLEGVPQERWLDLFNARYLITDKTGDGWIDGIYFDRQHPVNLAQNGGVAVSYLPDFEADQIRLLASGQLGAVEVVSGDGQKWRLTAEPIGDQQYSVSLPSPTTLSELHVAPCSQSTECTLEALTLVDTRDGTFYALVPGEYRLIHSGDVKIYENMDVLPRAYLVEQWQWAADGGESVRLMQDPRFDGRSSAVLAGSPQVAEAALPPGSAVTGAGPAEVTIETYEPEYVAIRTNHTTDSLLILTDAAYPGWNAFVDGERTTVYQADGLFRGVLLPAGAHEVVFQYESATYRAGLMLFISSLFIMVLALLFRMSPGRVKS